MISQRIRALARFVPTGMFVAIAFIHIGQIGFAQTALGQESSRTERNRGVQALADRPLVLGHGVGLYEVGPLIAEDDFETLENWVVQIQENSEFEPANVEARDGTMDCFLPGRGCTAWFKTKFPTRVTITYDVVCPTHDPKIKGVLPTDVNNFWMATDPVDADQGLFDLARYTGDFGTYDKMHGYYASTGGRKNTTTRMRRYPRNANGKPIDHVALDDKDGRLGYLIVPDQAMKVQLVAYDDVVQYIVDGKLIYQMGKADAVQLESHDNQGKRSQRDAIYDLERYPIYREGYFGFRMVRTHHVYSNFKVHSLEPIEGGKRRPTVRVDSLGGLREAVTKSDQQIVLQPGNYRVEDNKGFRFSGSNNDVELSGCYIEVPMAVASGQSLFYLAGDHITLRGGTIEDTDPEGIIDVKDFGAYNQRAKLGGMNDIKVPGDDNRIIGMKMTVRGSYPYGYGNMYGIGNDSIIELSKHCGIQIRGDRTLVDGCDIKMQAFGHAIYVQGSDRTTIRNTHVEGTVRPSNDCYNETNDGDLAKRSKYQLQWPDTVKGVPIPRDHMINCTEDGIRAYGRTGEMIVENCVVKKCRGGIKLYMAKSATVTNCKVLDCVVQGYSLPSRGVISGCSGNAAYGPLLYVHFDKHHSQQVDLGVLPSPHGIGDHPLAAIKGRGHRITFTQSGEAKPKTKPKTRPIIVGYPMRFGFLSVDYPEVPIGYKDQFAKHAPDTYTAEGITINNGTDQPVILSKLSTDNVVTSRGPIRDLGTGNSKSEAQPALGR